MSADTVVDIYEKPGVPYSTSADVYSTSTVGAVTPPVETAAVVNPGMGGGGPAPISTTPPLSFTTGSPIPAQSPVVGTPFTLDIKPYFVNGGSSRAYSIFSGSLPPGLALNGTTGVVAGTPSTPGSSTVMFSAVDNAGNAANSNGVVFTAAPANMLVLLLHLEGANSSQTDPIIDSSPAAHPNLTRNALSMFSNVNKKFGVTGLQSLGATSSIFTEVHADFGFTGDYTVELEVTLSSFAFTNRVLFDGTMNGTKVGAKIVIVWDGSGEPIVTLVNSAGATIVSSGYVSRTGFRQVRICRAGNLLYLFVDGVLIGSGAETGTYSTPCALCFGGPYGGGTGAVASFDEVRVLNGVAASTASFARPTYQWQNIYPEAKLASAPASRYWRINADSGAPFTSVAELEYRATVGGADMTTPGGGSPTASNSYSANFPSFAFDNNNTTVWSTDGLTSAGWLSYDFGSPVSVAQISVDPGGIASRGPYNFFIEYSSNNTTWTTAVTYTSVIWAASVPQLFV